MQYTVSDFFSYPAPLHQDFDIQASLQHQEQHRGFEELQIPSSLFIYEAQTDNQRISTDNEDATSESEADTQRKSVRTLRGLKNVNYNLGSLKIRKVPKKKQRTYFTMKEDLVIAKYYSRLGKKWPLIAPKLTNRTPSKVKNRFYSYTRKKGILDALLFILNGLEEEDEIEKFPEEILSPFRNFIPSVHGQEN